MCFKNIFEITSFEKLQGELRWLVQGRAYEDIKLGEELFCKASGNLNLKIWVKGILIYRSIVPEINSGLTGELTIQLNEHVDLKGIKMLYRWV